MMYIKREVVDTAMSYQQYRHKIDRLMGSNQTTGNNHSKAMLHYTTMNVVRMERLDRTTRLVKEVAEMVKNIRQPMIWLTLTEAWCGDAAQILPVLQKMADENPLIELRLLLRDEHPRLMDAFLTDGGRSIPKVIFLDTDTLKVLGSWGPRPKAAQQLMLDAKAEMAGMNDKEAKKERYQDLVKEMQKWYAKDKTSSTQREVAATVKALRVINKKVGQ